MQGSKSSHEPEYLKLNLRGGLKGRRWGRVVWVVEVGQEEFVDSFEGIPGGVDRRIARDDPLESFSYHRLVDRWP